MEPNSMTSRPQLIKILLAISLYLDDLRLSTEGKIRYKNLKNVFLFVLPQGPSPVLRAN